MFDPETNARIQVWRQKANAGKLSIEEMREAVAVLRGGRRSATEASAKRSSSSKRPAQSADDMLKDLEGL
jgi:hypothetical protein